MSVSKKLRAVSQAVGLESPEFGSNLIEGTRAFATLQLGRG
jgi:hypothetical protein